MGRAASVIGILILALSCSACGFRPLYGEYATKESTSVDLARIQLKTNNNRVDYFVRERLLELLQTGTTGEPALFQLNLTVDERLEGVAIEEDTSVTRFNLTLFARFDLIDLDSGAVVHQGTSRAITSYNVVDNQFSTVVAQRKAQERAGRDLADDLKLRLAVVFDRQRRPGRLDQDEAPASDPS